MKTNPQRTRRNPGVLFPPGKQKQAVHLPGPFHEKRNNPTGLFSRFLVHSGAPKKQSLKSTCFVSSDFPCFNLFPKCSLPPTLATTGGISHFRIRLASSFLLSSLSSPLYPCLLPLPPASTSDISRVPLYLYFCLNSPMFLALRGLRQILTIRLPLTLIPFPFIPFADPLSSASSFCFCLYAIKLEVSRGF